MPKVDLPIRCPHHLKGSLRVRYNYLVTQFYQLQHLWEVQLKDHKDYWNIKAAHEFWCEHGIKTFCGRKFAWCETWLIDAMDEVRAEVLDLEDASRRIKRIRATQRNAVRRVSLPDSSPDRRIYTKKVISSDTTESDAGMYSPTQKPVYRAFDPYEHTKNMRPGSQAHPIMIIQDSEDDDANIGEDDSDERNDNYFEQRYLKAAKAKSMRHTPAPLKRFSTIRIRAENRARLESKCDDENTQLCQHNNHNPSTPVKKKHLPNRGRWAEFESLGKKRTLRKKTEKQYGYCERAQKSPKHSHSSTSGAGSDTSSGEGGCHLSSISEWA